MNVHTYMYSDVDIHNLLPRLASVYWFKQGLHKNTFILLIESNRIK